MLTGNIPVQGLHAKRGALCLGQGGGAGGKRWTSHFVSEPSPSRLTHPFTEASKPLNS